MITIEVPDSYGYVILSCLVGQLVASNVMGGKVMNARKEYKVGYPNCYATPGFHKEADTFNRIQRGHQNFFESLTTFTGMALVSGLKHPLTVAASCALFNVGAVLYQVGYADTTLDVKMARYKKGGMLKWIGFLSLVGTTVSMSGSLVGWW